MSSNTDGRNLMRCDVCTEETRDWHQEPVYWSPDDREPAYYRTLCDICWRAENDAGFDREMALRQREEARVQAEIEAEEGAGSE